MPSFARACIPALALAFAVVLVLLAACGSASPPATQPAPATGFPVAPYCDFTCWRVLGKFLAETCQCKTAACAEQTRERMEAWVTNEVIEAKNLDGRQEEVELPLELAPYDAVDNACGERFQPPPSRARRRIYVDHRAAAR